MTSQYSSSAFILQTKLNRPGVTRDLVVRPRLLQRLNAGLDGAITLVVAPAGFGKTTLVNSWIQAAKDENNAPVPAAWLTLEEGDGDREVFLPYFIAALRTIFPDACPGTLSLLTARQRPPGDLLTSVLNNELDLLPSRFIIVLDDLHAPQNSRDIYDTLNDWLRHWPRHMHLILLSRFNPPLPLPSLRARGLLTEIRSHDLRFLPAETAEYFQRIMGASADTTEVMFLQERLEGWIAGLKMAFLSMGDREAARSFTSALLDKEIFIADFLADEVFSRQTPSIQNFLLITSITDQFCGSLCEAILDSQNPECNARECLDYLEAVDLFVVSLDKNREWYRYHHMFRDMLRQRLLKTMSPEQVSALHARAADWFALRNQPDQAIHHALEGGNLESAVRYMEQGLCDVLNREDRMSLERWLRLMPENLIRQRLELLVMKAFIHMFRWEPEGVARIVEQAEVLIGEDYQLDHTGVYHALIDMFKGQSFYDFNKHDKAITYNRKALAQLPEEWRYVRGVAGSFVGMSLYATGRAAEAGKYLLSEYERSSNVYDGYTLRLLLAQIINDIQAGSYENAERTARTMLRQAVQGQLPVIEGWAHYLLGFINYEWNDLDTAARHFTDVADNYFLAQLAAARNGMLGQGMVFQARNRGNEALEAIKHLGEMDLQARGREEMDTASARARIMLMQGNQEGAERWTNLYIDLPPTQSLLPWMEIPQMTRARIFIARNKPGDIEATMGILDTIGEIAETTFNNRMIIEVLALRALALLNRGDSAGAAATLIRSVEMARRGLFTRVYVDMGPQMHKLLQQIAGRGPIAITVGRILAAFQDNENSQAMAVPSAISPAGTRPDNSDSELHEHLTPRELEVLILMSEPISLKVIASRLNISYGTARRYTINLYSKFGVHSRWEAVDAAIRKGIIVPR